MVTGCVGRTDLDARVFQLAGPGATNCGDVRRGESSTAAMACAEEAIAKHEPFKVVAEGRTVDSDVIDVLVGSRGGRLTWVRLDSDTSGGSQIFRRPKLFETICSEVRFTDRGSGRTFTCDPAVSAP